MALRPCPVCDAPAPRRLEAPSQDASVTYYRCPECGHVWAADKNDSGKIRHITEIPDEIGGDSDER
jgi:hypothetical protein